MIERELFGPHEDSQRGADFTWSRRRFLSAGSVAGLQRAWKCVIPYARFWPAGLMPVAHAPWALASVREASGLRVLNDRPLNAEIPAHLLDDDVTPAARLFVRNNGIAPVNVDSDRWRLSVTGEACANPQIFSIADLKRRFQRHTYQLQLECAGNGRAEFRPRVPGNQWTTGAIGCPQWSGVRLRDVLQACGMRDDAVYIGYRGADAHLSGDPDKDAISRGVPVAKAFEDEALVAFAMNGEAIPAEHGAPLRLVCGGWPGSVSGKWLTELLIRDRLHDGAKMMGTSYRVPCRPIAAGQSIADEDMCIIESMPVKSLVTFPRSGVSFAAGSVFEVRGHAWAGDLAVAAVEISMDFGATWVAAQLDAPPNRLAWQRWRTPWTLPVAGYYEIWARATDTRGRSQPMLVPGWNPRGYLNNAAHRIAVRAL